MSDNWDLGTCDEEVYGVPNWDGKDGSDAGNADYTQIGPGDDKWGGKVGWDGCSPVAASMILAYHEDQETPYWNDYGPYRGRSKHRDWYMDRLHIRMDTGETVIPVPIGDDITMPWNIDNGIEQFTSPSGLEFTANNQIFNIRGNVKDEIQDNDPCMLSMFNGPYNKKDGEWIDGHSVVVVGYKQYDCGWSCLLDDRFYHKVYDGYGNEHKIDNGTWKHAMVTRIWPD